MLPTSTRASQHTSWARVTEPTETNMYVYLSSERLSTEVPEVTLVDGCTPMLGSQGAISEESGRHREIVLEPAAWFKVLVLDSISIDCRNNKISWSSSVPLPHPELSHLSDVAGCHVNADMALIDEQKKRLSESMYVGGECFGNETELDEVFDTVQELLESYASGLISTEQFRSGIFQQLHCYVLPSIKLSSDDLANLQRAFNDQEKYIDKANAAILKQDARVESVESSMCRLRQKFVNELGSAKKVPLYSVEFADLLLKHLQDDSRRAWDELDSLQNAVETAKELKFDVGEARKERDAHFEVYQKLLLARETLKEYLDRTIAAESHRESKIVCVVSLSSPKHGHTRFVNDPLHNIYVEMYHKTQEERDKLSALIDRKVLVISVKEAIRAAIDELMSDNETFGVDLDRTGRQRATDVLCRSTIPRQWLTMTEQISSLLTGYGALAQEFKRFTAHLNNVCESALYEKHLKEVLLLDDSSDTVSLCSTDSGILSHCAAPHTRSIPMVAPYCKVTDVRHIDRATLKRGRNKRAQSKRRTIDAIQNVDSGIESDVSSSLPTSLQGNAADFPGPCSLPSKVIPDIPQKVGVSSGSNPGLLLLDGWFGANSDALTARDSQRDYLKKVIESLKADIHAHFEDMCRQIQSELHHTNSTYYRKVWLCYESHFYEKTMPCLTQLYELAYVSTAHGLATSIPILSPKDLGLSGIVAEHILSEKTPSSLESSRSSSSVSLLSLVDPVNDIALAESPPMMFHLGDFPKAGVIRRKNGIRRSRPMSHFTEESESESDVPAPNAHVKCVTVHVPNAVTVVYDRRTWPAMHRTSSHDDNIECAVDALTVDDCGSAASSSGATSVGPRPPPERDMAMTPEWAANFSDAMASIASVVGETSPLLKFQHLTHCLREISQQLTKLQKSLNHEATGACSDDLIDVLVMLLCNSDPGYVAQLYPHITLLADLMPPFFEGGRYSFSLVQFSVAFQFIQDTLVMKKKKLSGSGVDTHGGERSWRGGWLSFLCRQGVNCVTRTVTASFSGVNWHFQTHSPTNQLARTLTVTGLALTVNKLGWCAKWWSVSC